MKLKSREKFTPYGHQLLLPEVGMKKAVTGSFSTIVTAFAQIVAKNPALAQKQGWPTNRVDQENWIEQRECHRLIASGFPTFVEMDGVSPPINVGGASRSSQGVGGAVAAAKSIVAGVGLWLDWVGPDGVPVNQAHSEKRAAVCADCPKNDGGDWKQYFIGPAAALIKKQLEIKHQLELKTSFDEKLTVCSACDCPLTLKVHANINHIVSHTKESVWPKLDPRCWMLSESGRK